jgi:hypothetical protein
MIILLYSPKKNIAKIIDEYSTLYPATNSASASGKSKGALLVSAIMEIINRMNVGNNIITYQLLCICAQTISEKFILPAKNIIGNNINVIDTS